MFDDPAVDKEVFVRRKLLKIYNKRECDFTKGAKISEYFSFDWFDWKMSRIFGLHPRIIWFLSLSDANQKKIGPEIM